MELLNPIHAYSKWTPRLAAGLVLTLGLSSLAVSIAGGDSLGPSNAQRHAVARHDAQHLLTLVVPPTDASRLSGPIGGKNSPLSQPGSLSGDPDKVDLSRFYLAPDGSSALAWVKTHAPKGSKLTGTGSVTEPGAKAVRELTFSFNDAGFLTTPSLNYALLPLSGNRVEIRVDAEVLYTPRKSKYAIVASDASTIKVVATRSSDVTTNRTTDIDSSDASTIASIIKDVNALPVQQPGVMYCPVDLGATMTISFYLTGSSSAYATVTADPAGCGQVVIKQYSASGALLGTGRDEGGKTISDSVAGALGIANWPGSTTP